MSYIKSYQIIQGPIFTEKSLIEKENDKYYFWVDLKATKPQIAQAFSQTFEVKPLNVATVTIKGKSKTDWRSRKTSRKPNRKKAIITVAKGQKIKLLEPKGKK